MGLEQHSAPKVAGLLVRDLIALSPSGLPLNVSLGLVVQVAQLLERAHALGRVHGSLGPGAVWCTRGGDVWLEWAPQVLPVHRSLPPEIRHGETPTVASDVYALGALAYELLTGLSVSRAWAKAPLVELQHVASAVYFNAQVPRQIDEIIAGALSRDPLKRPQTVATLGRMAELWVPAGSWEIALTGLLDAPQFESALQPLPFTCEPAGAALAAPEAPTQPVPIPQEAPHIEALPTLRVRAMNDDTEGARQPRVMVLLAALLAAAA